MLFVSKAVDNKLVVLVVGDGLLLVATAKYTDTLNVLGHPQYALAPSWHEIRHSGELRTPTQHVTHPAVQHQSDVADCIRSKTTMDSS